MSRIHDLRPNLRIDVPKNCPNPPPNTPASSYTHSTASSISSYSSSPLLSSPSLATRFAYSDNEDEDPDVEML